MDSRPPELTGLDREGLCGLVSPLPSVLQHGLGSPVDTPGGAFHRPQEGSAASAMTSLAMQQRYLSYTIPSPGGSYSSLMNPYLGGGPGVSNDPLKSPWISPGSHGYSTPPGAYSPYAPFIQPSGGESLMAGGGREPYHRMFDLGKDAHMYQAAAYGGLGSAVYTTGNRADVREMTDGIIRNGGQNGANVKDSREGVMVRKPSTERRSHDYGSDRRSHDYGSDRRSHDYGSDRRSHDYGSDRRSLDRSSERANTNVEQASHLAKKDTKYRKDVSGDKSAVSNSTKKKKVPTATLR